MIEATDILVTAFHDDPLACWLFPDARDRQVAAPYLFRPFVERAAATGGLAVSGDAAVAVWLTVAADEPAFPDHDGEPPEALRPHLERLAAFARLAGARHPTGRAHLYLPFLGVVPAHRGNGVGAALLAARLATCDDEGVPVYLEASSARSRPLYERCGFQATGEPVVLPGGPPIWPMWREPAHTTTRKENDDDR